MPTVSIHFCCEKPRKKVYFAHPYSLWERPQNERHNGLFRLYVPKGASTEDYSDEYILASADELNGRPRRKLGYHNPEELYDNFLDRILPLPEEHSFQPHFVLSRVTCTCNFRKKIVQRKRCISELARRLGQSPQNFNKKLKRETVTTEKLILIGYELAVKFEQSYTLETGEKISISNEPQK